MLIGFIFALGMLWFEHKASRNQGAKAVVPLTVVVAIAIAAPCISGVLSIATVRALSKALETFLW